MPYQKFKTRLDSKESVLQLLEKHKFIRGDCWRTLLANCDRTGHARVMIEGKMYLIHRLSMYIFKDFDLNSNALICHKVECKHADCWNPEHLYVGDSDSNGSDRIVKGYTDPPPFFRCGHPRNAENTYRSHWGGYKDDHCRICSTVRAREYYLKRKEARLG